MTTLIYEERQDQIHRKGKKPFAIECDKESLAGAVSQRACVFCGSRVVLYPIADEERCRKVQAELPMSLQVHPCVRFPTFTWP